MAEETKETKKIIPESKKKKKRKKKKVLLKVSVVFLLLVVIGWFTFGAKVMKLRSEANLTFTTPSIDPFCTEWAPSGMFADSCRSFDFY